MNRQLERKFRENNEEYFVKIPRKILGGRYLHKETSGGLWLHAVEALLFVLSIKV